MARNFYHSTVRVGNWYENKLCEKALVEHEERNKSSKEMFQKLTHQLLAEAEASVCPDGVLHFDNTVLIHYPDVILQKGTPRESQGSCTMSTAPAPEVVRGMNDYIGTNITASILHHKPVVRNVFVITPWKTSQQPGAVLHYGEPFQLVYNGHGNLKVYLSSPSGCALHSGRGSRRQEVLLDSTSSIHSAWIIHPPDMEARVIYEGHPVEVGARVMIVQMMTNQPLVVEEEFYTATIFGSEPEMSVGVVNRATTRAAYITALMTWTQPRCLPQQHQLQADEETKEHEKEIHHQDVEKKETYDEEVERREIQDKDGEKQQIDDKEFEEQRKEDIKQEIEIVKTPKCLSEATKFELDLNHITSQADPIINLENLEIADDNIPEATLERMEEVQKAWRYVKDHKPEKKRELYNKNIR